jgi:TM2 domain-containing membrane protein YozV
MSLQIKDTTSVTLPSSVKSSLAQMNPEQQLIFEEDYLKKMKNPTTLLLLAILFPIHYFLLGQTGKGVLFLLTGGGVYVWYIIDWFRIKGMVNEFNEEIAKTLIRDMKTMGS